MIYNEYFLLFAFNLVTGFVSVNACQGFNNPGVSPLHRSTNSSTRSLHWIRKYALPFIYIQPGTKWCGPGNRSASYDDLGSEKETDECCRDHDHCSDNILAGETKHNLTNNVVYTRFSCKCDEQFRDCLRGANKRAANNIGNIYFNTLGTKCFREDYPTINCVKKKGWFRGKCLEYSYNTTATKHFQWFDVNEY